MLAGDRAGNHVLDVDVSPARGDAGHEVHGRAHEGDVAAVGGDGRGVRVVVAQVAAGDEFVAFALPIFSILVRVPRFQHNPDALFNLAPSQPQRNSRLARREGCESLGSGNIVAERGFASNSYHRRHLRASRIKGHTARA